MGKNLGETECVKDLGFKFLMPNYWTSYWIALHLFNYLYIRVIYTFNLFIYLFVYSFN